MFPPTIHVFVLDFRCLETDSTQFLARTYSKDGSNGDNMRGIDQSICLYLGKWREGGGGKAEVRRSRRPNLPDFQKTPHPGRPS